MVSVVDANPRAGDWKRLVAKVAREECGAPLLEGPLKVTMIFYRVRPQGHLTVGGLSKQGRETPFPITKPDAGKLARGTIDAMTGVIYKDDAQVVEEVAIKRYGHPPRVEITVEEVLLPEQTSQESLFEVVEAPAPWERETAGSADGHPQKSADTSSRANSGVRKRGKSGAGTSHNDHNQSPEKDVERPPWETQDPVKP